MLTAWTSISPGGCQFVKIIDLIGERGRNRTYNLVIKSHLLCQLSYAPFGWGWAARDVRLRYYNTPGRFVIRDPCERFRA
jgi:hypothetical protein